MQSKTVAHKIATITPNESIKTSETSDALPSTKPCKNSSQTAMVKQMKKVVYVGILIVAVIIAFFAGMAVSKGGGNRSVVGVYETSDWNGKTGTLVLLRSQTKT